MSVVLHLPELTDDHDPRFDDPAFVADLYADRLRFTVSWPEVLAMAVRDGAASVHYHPWRTNAVCDDVLSYVVVGTRYGLLAPDAESGRRLLADARRLAAPGLFARLWAWVAGGSVGCGSSPHPGSPSGVWCAGAGGCWPGLTSCGSLRCRSPQWWATRTPNPALHRTRPSDWFRVA